MRLAKGLNCMFSQLVKLTKYEAPFDNVAKLELDNPKKKNALSVDLLSQVLFHRNSLTPPYRKSINNPPSELAFSEAASRDISAPVQISRKD